MPGIEGAEIAVSASAIQAPPKALPSQLIGRVLRSRLIPLCLVLATCLVFLPALWNGFVEWDDQVNLYQNPEYRGLTWPQIRWMFTSVLMGHWIPLTWLTFGLDYVLWEMKPVGYHLTSLVIFALNAPALYFVALRLLRHATRFPDGTLRLSAVAATLFFTIHPLRAESVGWVTERRDVLSGLFFLLTVLMYLKAVDGEEKRRRWRLAASVGLFALALVSKGSVMVLPLALVLLDFYPLRRLGWRWREWIRMPARGVWLEKIPYFVLGIAGGAITYYAQSANSFITPLERYPLSARPAMVLYSLWFYIAKTAIPQGLSPLYELPARVSLVDRQFLVPALGVTAITAAVVALWRRWPAGLAVWAYYAIALAPVIGIVHSGHQLTNDRYSYLPGLGLALVVGAAAGAAVQLVAAGKLRSSLAGALVALGVLWCCALAYLSAQQVQIWRESESLWRYALESDPNCAICRGNLGTLVRNQGHLELAIAEFDRVLALRPDYVKVHEHVGYTYVLLGNYPRAIEHFNLYVKKYPNDVEGLANLGAALLQTGRTLEAIETVKRALKIRPGHVLSHVNLAYAYLELGRRSEALDAFRQAVTLKYDTPQAWFGLARVHFEGHDTRSARTAWGILGQFDAQLAARAGPAFLQTW
jgi:tetratricopeptide (TPR) repeat protein